jgi:hypothetical protein
MPHTVINWDCSSEVASVAILMRVTKYLLFVKGVACARFRSLPTVRAIDLRPPCDDGLTFLMSGQMGRGLFTKTKSFDSKDFLTHEIASMEVGVVDLGSYHDNTLASWLCGYPEA